MCYCYEWRLTSHDLNEQSSVTSSFSWWYSHSLRCHRIGWVIQTLILSLGAAYDNMKSMTLNIFFCFYRENLIDKRIEGAVSRMQSVIELGRVIRDRKTLPVKVDYHFDPIHFCNPLGYTLCLLYRKHDLKCGKKSLYSLVTYFISPGLSCTFYIVYQ